MKQRKLQLRSCFALSALIISIWSGRPAKAQSMPTQTTTTAGSAQDDETTRAELARFDQFLDSHREISEQLRKDPSLVNKERFVKDHPALQTYLSEHPGIREEINENPNAFMQQAYRFDRREDRSGIDVDNRTELQRFNEFLGSHREIAEQVRKNPSLMNHEGFVENHPALLTYLQEHPEARQEIRQDPDSFMRQDYNFDRRENGRADGNDANRAERESFDRFLVSHREIAEQVRKNPSLVDNDEFSRNHPELQAYLQEHPGVRDEVRDNPNGFVRQENNFERREDSGDRDIDREKSAKFKEFLGDHRDIANELSRDPSQAKNRDFVERHPELHDYLKNHPDVSEELMKNPQGFVKSAQPTTNANNDQGRKTPTFAPKANH